jgi:hypothetical protein
VLSLWGYEDLQGAIDEIARVEGTKFDKTKPVLVEAVGLVTAITGDPQFKKTSAMFMADFITSAEARVQPGRAHRLQHDMKPVASAITAVAGALGKGLKFQAADYKHAKHLGSLVDSSHAYLWAMSADKHFEGFDWNGIAGLRLQATGFRFVILLDFVQAEAELRNLRVFDGRQCQ